jgi:hypothetical protein
LEQRDEHYEQHEISSELTGDGTPVIKSDSGVYVPLNRMCAALGVAPQGQITKLRNDPLYEELIRQYAVKTRGGVQLMWCLHVDAVGMWLGSLNSRNVRADKRARLLAYQRELSALARALLLGETESEAIVPVLATLDRKRLAHVEYEQKEAARFVLRLEARIGKLEEAAHGDEE